MSTRVSARRRAASGLFVAVLCMPALAVFVARPDAQTSTQTIECASGFGEVLEPAGTPPFIPLTSLKTVENPVFPRDPVTGVRTLRADLAEYIADVPSAIRLGKALFWDMQAGSDDRTACASCHFQAGADARDRNQVHPGYNDSFVDTAVFAPNHQLQAYDFPFTDPATGDMTDNVVGSQGIRKSTYGGLSKQNAEQTTQVFDPVFNTGGKNVRQVTGIQSPSVINAVHNHRNFWDGRAQPEFNGVDPFGARNTTARVWALDVRGTPGQIDIRVPNASLASQAVGPPMNPVEMNADKRTFPELGKKLLARKPLALQKVAPTDSVLGAVADTTTGLKVTYASLIQAAFQKKWWNSTKSVSVGGKTYTMLQANFSLYWGLSLMLYQATLVSDDTPIDRYLDGRVVDLLTGQIVLDGNPSALDAIVSRLAGEGILVTRESILNGLALFERPLLPETIRGGGIPAGGGAGCSACHVGAELTSASVRNLTGHGVEPGDAALRNIGFDLRMERMFMQLPPVPDGADRITFDSATYAVNVTRVGGVDQPAPIPARAAVYDAGWYNVAVRPAQEHAGLGAKDPFGNFLSWTQLFQAYSNPGLVKVPGGGLGCPDVPPAAPPTSVYAGEVLNPQTGLPLLAGPLRKTEPVAVRATFKTPGLRNVDLTGPYLHNGGKSTLMQVVELYDDGGDFPHSGQNPTRSPLIMPLNMTAEQRQDLVAFLLALTDDRVRFRKAPFDHPQLILPNGVDAQGADVLQQIPAVGAGGTQAPLTRFLALDPMR